MRSRQVASDSAAAESSVPPAPVWAAPYDGHVTGLIQTEAIPESYYLTLAFALS